MKVEKGNKVTVNYEGRFESGEVFDTSKHGDHNHPLTFVVGNHEVIAGFENAVIGMQKGEIKEITIDKTEAYGEYREELKQKIGREEFGDLDLKEGMTLMMNNGEYNVPVKIGKVTNEEVELDMNHQLAGKNLIFSLEIVEIELS